MKQKAIMFLLLTTCLTFNVYADTIFLKDGRQLTCEKSWEVGKNIKYEYLGATVTVPRNKVLSIEKKPLPSWGESGTNKDTASLIEKILSWPKEIYNKHFQKHVKPVIEFNDKMVKDINSD